MIQCDFDGTVTEDDISYYILNKFAQGDWRRLLHEYQEKRISVDKFNSSVFALVKADKLTLINAIKGKSIVRKGFQNLVLFCNNKNYRLVIISNGLEFYIREIFNDLGLNNLEIYAAQAEFHPDGLVVQYIGPEGERLDDGLKEMYVRLFLKQGYNVIYIGDGSSDIEAAKQAHRIFARDQLLNYCRENSIECEPFNDFNDIVRKMDVI